MTDYTTLPKNAQQIIKSRSTILDNGCWEWKQKSHSYGAIMIKGTSYAAHRLSYAAFNGPIGNLHVCHTCDYPPCVNPEHLFLGTAKDNMADMTNKDRSGARELRNRLGKLTDEQVREIRRKHARGFPPSWIAKDFGVTASYIRSIVTVRVQRGYGARHHAL